MAYNLCSSPSSLFHDVPSISSSSRKFKLRNLSSSFQPSSSSPPNPKPFTPATSPCTNPFPNSYHPTQQPSRLNPRLRRKAVTSG
ncbi:Pentatricopeptide repeat-containing protein [Spatholobus suberectus]|nr:Pentatricopeptide repeat-containing protein [Spatholobus suberectus]